MLKNLHRIALALAAAYCCAYAQSPSPKNPSGVGSSPGNPRSNPHTPQSADSRSARAGGHSRPSGPNPVFWLDLATSLAQGKTSHELSDEVAVRGTDLYFDDGDAEYLRLLGATDELMNALRNAQYIYVDYSLDLARWKSDAIRDEAAVRLVLSKRPHDAGLHWLLAMALEVEGKLADAIPEARKSIELKPDFSAAHRTLSELLTDTGQHLEALSEAKETVRLMPNIPAPHYVLGTALIANGDAQTGAAELRKAVELAPDYYLPHSVLGDYLFGQKDYNEAAHELREAVRLNPAFELAHFGLGRTLIEKQDFDGAAFEFKEALRLEPKNNFIHAWLSSALFRDGQIDEAASEARIALLYDPKSASAKRLFVAARTKLGETAGAGAANTQQPAGSTQPAPSGGLAGSTWTCQETDLGPNHFVWNYSISFLDSGVVKKDGRNWGELVGMDARWQMNGPTILLLMPENIGDNFEGTVNSPTSISARSSHKFANNPQSLSSLNCTRQTPLPQPQPAALAQSFSDHPPYDDKCLRTGQGNLGSVTITNICSEPIDLKWCYRKQGDSGSWVCNVAPRLEPNHTLQSPFCNQCAYDGRAAAYLSSRNLLGSLPSDAEMASWSSSTAPQSAANAAAKSGMSDGQRQWHFVNPSQNWDTLTFEIRGRNGDSTSDDWNDEATLQTITLKPGESWTEACGGYFSLDIKWQLASASDPQVDTFYASLVCYANNFVWNNNHNLREYDFPRQ